MCCTIRHVQGLVTPLSERPLPDGEAQGWWSLEDIRAYLFCRGDDQRSPNWNLSDLRRAADRWPEFIVARHFAQHADTGEVSEFFRAGPLFIELSAHYSRERRPDVLEISLRLPADRHPIALPTPGPGAQAGAAHSTSHPPSVTELQREWKRIFEFQLDAEVSRLLDAGFLKPNFAIGERAFKCLSGMSATQKQKCVP